MKYKVGDKVRIKSEEWYAAHRCSNGYAEFDGLKFSDIMVKFCRKEATIIRSDRDGTYLLDIGDTYWFNDEMLEDPNLDNSKNTSASEQLIKDIADVIKSHNLGVSVSEKDGKLIIEPLKVNDDLPIDTPCMVSEEGEWCLKYYAGNQKCYCDGYETAEKGTASYKYIIPFDKFDPNHIVNSIKYNIVK